VRVGTGDRCGGAMAMSTLLGPEGTTGAGVAGSACGRVPGVGVVVSVPGMTWPSYRIVSGCPWVGVRSGWLVGVVGLWVGCGLRIA